MDDEQIIDLYWQRDEQAIVQTDARYGAYCMKISMNILDDRSDSEENVNDTYMNTWDAIPPQRPQLLGAFIGKICRNLALNKYKARHAQKRKAGEFALSLDELDLCTPSGVNVEDEVEMAALSRCISRFLWQQDKFTRQVFVCRYFYGDSLADVAKQFGCSQSRLKSLLMRTRRRLKLYLQKEGYTL